MAQMTRKEAVLEVLHAAGTAGLTVSAISDLTGLKRYDVRQVLGALAKKHKATCIAWRRIVGVTDLEKVWACSCGMDHRGITGPMPDVRPPAPPVKLDEETKALAREGLAAARAVLDEVERRKSAS